MPSHADSTSVAHRLRKICVAYPQHVVAEAVRLALVDQVADDAERTAIAGLIVHWIRAGDDSICPPVTEATFQTVRRALKARAH